MNLRHNPTEIVKELESLEKLRPYLNLADHKEFNDIASNCQKMCRMLCDVELMAHSICVQLDKLKEKMDSYPDVPATEDFPVIKRQR